MRIISRLNIGGPAIQAITLIKRLEDYGYITTLVRGSEEPEEGNMDYLASELGVTPVHVETLRRNPGWHDIGALWALIRILRRDRPHIVHTHAAKAGTLGRAATMLAFPLRSRRPLLVHTYHGHSLSGYFSSRITAAYRRIEQALARVTDRLIAVSEEVRDELVGMGVAPASKFKVVRLGFDLSPFTVNGPSRAQAREALRAELGIPLDSCVVTLVARLVPIKRVDRFLRAAHSLRDLTGVWFLVVGDGELRDRLQGSAEAVALAERLVWAGFRRDMPAVYFASDVVVLTSDNEGTPVSLIEAQAAGVPVVSTHVGGTASVVAAGRSGLVSPTQDESGLVAAIRSLAWDPEKCRRFGEAGQQHAKAVFSLDRLASDIDETYRTVINERANLTRRSRGRTG